MSQGEVTIRVCTELKEWEQCVGLQREVWGFSDLDLVPLRMFSVASKIGGQVIGAYDGERMVGFALAIPGTRNGHSYLHSHMLAVAESHRNHGLGRKIKLFQREDAIARGYELMEWTFDPLEIKNAFLNLTKLGAIARRYNINQYGITSSPLQGFLPTDRLVAEWWLKSKRVETLLNTGSMPAVKPELKIEVPAEIYAWKAHEDTRAKAKEVQSRNRDLFFDSFGRGLACLGYERDAHGNGAFLVGRWDENWSYATGPITQ
ncbi:GCN5-related N-acetyltransferase [Candidatus Koribacter versatilis Ellin345]|uniref:GCN5-related N-acetyltransferase n=1 Tax=Koribacter versatilis (strain Ellin345) TaxID=204669 RepID=Q1IPL3_KORVE|nr:GNAT family N-acetyltransferase [Candidatus Koribacter versatilis]ABF41187.1 GCN5-related N-acetyltransferase [Candidatus Koribacter versatilis Ellin345]